MDNQEPIVTLIDENGEEFEFVVMDTFFVEDNEYAVLVPLEEDGSEDDEEEEEAIVLRIEDDEEGNQILVPVEEEDEWKKIADVWENRIQEQEGNE